MKLPVSPDTMAAEVESAEKILTVLKERLNSIPGVDTPASEEQTIEYLRQVCGELMVASNKCQGLASVIAELTV